MINNQLIGAVQVKPPFLCHSERIFWLKIIQVTKYGCWCCPDACRPIRFFQNDRSIIRVEDPCCVQGPSRKCGKDPPAINCFPCRSEVGA
jgi:hypothetical protein